MEIYNITYDNKEDIQECIGDLGFRKEEECNYEIHAAVTPEYDMLLSEGDESRMTVVPEDGFLIISNKLNTASIPIFLIKNIIQEVSSDRDNYIVNLGFVKYKITFKK